MASKNLPKWKERQKLLYPTSKDPKKNPKHLRELAEKCLSEGLIHDAFEYFRGAQDRDGLLRIAELAVKDGDAFLLDGVEKALGPDENLRDRWNDLGYRAFESGKFVFAKRAFRKTENELMLAKIKAEIGEEESDQPKEAATEDAPGDQ